MGAETLPRKGKMMTIKYKGLDKSISTRMADITFGDNETKLADRMADFLERVHGYEVMPMTEGWFTVAVEDQRDYKELVTIYKSAKRMLTNCMKYGF